MASDNPLVCRFGAFGDMVMMTPLLRRLHQRCGKPADVISIGHWSEVMFENMPYVRHVYTIDSRSAPYLFNRSQRKLVSTLRREPHDFAWICEFKPKTYKLMKRAGIDIDHSINARDHTHHIDEHSAAFLLRLGNESPDGFDYPTIEDDLLDTELFVSVAEVEECKHWLSTRGIQPDAPLVCIQAGNKKTTEKKKNDASVNPKYWPEDHWAEFIDQIKLELEGSEILLCGVPSEVAIADKIKALCSDSDRVHTIADDLPLRRLFALLSIAHSCISVDTGPAHAAAALNCPLTVLFGKTDARLCRPLSTNSKVIVVAGRNHSIDLEPGAASWEAAHSMSFIDVQSVLEGWRKSLSD